MKEIMQSICTMSLKQKTELAEKLDQMIREDKRRKSANIYAKKYIAILNALMGIVYDPKRRHHSQVVARVIMTKALADRGFCEREIGEAIGMDHSTINHFKKKFQDWKDVPQCYQREISIYKRFNTLICD